MQFRWHSLHHFYRYFFLYWGRGFPTKALSLLCCFFPYEMPLFCCTPPRPYVSCLVVYATCTQTRTQICLHRSFLCFCSKIPTCAPSEVVCGMLLPTDTDPILAANLRLYRSAADSMMTVSAAPIVAECLSLGADPLFRPSPALLSNGHGGYIADGVFVAAPGAREDEGGTGGEERDAARMHSSLEVMCSQNCLDAVALLMDALIRRATADDPLNIRPPEGGACEPPTFIPPAAAALLPPSLLRLTCSDMLRHPTEPSRLVNYLLSLRTVDAEGGGERPVFPVDACGHDDGAGGVRRSPLVRVHTNIKAVRALLANGADINVPTPRGCPSAAWAAEEGAESLARGRRRWLPIEEDFFLFAEAAHFRFQRVPTHILRELLDNGYDPDPSLLGVCTDATCSIGGEEDTLPERSLPDGGGARDTCVRGHEGCSVRHISGCTCTPLGRLALLSCASTSVTKVLFRGSSLEKPCFSKCLCYSVCLILVLLNFRGDRFSRLAIQIRGFQVEPDQLFFSTC